MEGSEIIAEFRALPQHRRYQALVVAARDALEVWRTFRSGGARIEYHDSVVGQHHVVDDALPERAFGATELVLAGRDWDLHILGQYREPIVAMQDDDLEFPDKVEFAYYAIYNLLRIVANDKHAPDEDLVMSQVSGAVEVELDDWLREWRTRTWDAWASLPDLVYPPCSLDDAVYQRLALNDLAGALALVPSDCRLRAMLLAIAGRREDAVATILRLFGAGDELRDWLAEHIGAMLPDAIAIDPSGTFYAVIHRERLDVREVGTGIVVQSTERPGSQMRRVRFVGPDLIWFAGERVDRIGAWATFWDAARLHRPKLDALGSHGKRILPQHASGYVPGQRVIAALGNGCVVACEECEVIVYGRGQRDTLAGVTVRGAAIDDENERIITFDDVSYSIWRRATGVVEQHAGDVVEVVWGGSRAFVMWADGTASLVAPSG